MTVSAVSALFSRVPFIAGSFARWPGGGNAAQDRGEPCDRGRIFDPFGESVLDAGTPCVFRAGLPDGVPLILAQGRLPRGSSTLRVRPVVRPVVRVRAFTCRRAREGRDGTTLGTITHGDRSSSPGSGERCSPRPRPLQVGTISV